MESVESGSGCFSGPEEGPRGAEAIGSPTVLGYKQAKERMVALIKMAHDTSTHHGVLEVLLHLRRAALAIGAVALLLQASCCPKAELGEAGEVPRQSPKRLFVAYARFLQSRDYARVVESMVPALQGACAEPLKRKKAFDEKASALENKIEARYGRGRATEFQQKIRDRIESVYLRAFHWRREDIDLANAEYVEQDGLVYARDRGTLFGLVGLRREDRWYLSSPRPEHFRDDLQALVHLLDGVNRFLDRLDRDISSGRVDSDRLRELLANPDI